MIYRIFHFEYSKYIAFTTKVLWALFRDFDKNEVYLNKA